MVEFIAIVSLVAGVLQIILFFKVWGMTNDVKALKKDHFCETQFVGYGQTASYLRRNLVLGNTDNVKRILLQNFIDNVEQAYGELKRGDYEKDENGREKWVDYQEKTYEKMRSIDIKVFCQCIYRLYFNRYSCDSDDTNKTRGFYRHIL